LFFLSFFSLLSTALSAQTLLRGRVELTGHAVAGATVSLQPGQHRSVTDAQGRFRFESLTDTTYLLSISGLEMQPIQRAVSLRPGETLELLLTAQPAARTLAEVDVYSSLPFRGIERLPESNDVQINAGKKMEVLRLGSLDANLATNSARQVFGKVPGTHVWENDGSGIQVNVATRGLSPNRSWEYNVRQNGHDVSADVFGYPEAYYNPPLEAVERIEVIRGAAALQYGPQFGGLLQYRLQGAPDDRKIALETQQTLGSYGLFSSYNAAGGTLGRLKYFGYFHHRDGSGWRQNSRYQVQHGHVRASYQLSARLLAEAEYSRMDYTAQQAGGLSDAQFAADARQSARARNWFEVPWNLGSLRLRYTLSPRTQLQWQTFGLLGQRNSIGYLRPITVADTIQHSTGLYHARQIDRDGYRNWGSEMRLLTHYTLRGRQQTFSAGLRYYAANTHRQQQGLGDTGTGFNLHLEGSGSFPRDLAYTTRNAAAFAEHILRIGRRWALVPGLRLEQVTNGAAGRFSRNSAGEELLLPPQRRSRIFLLAGIGAEYHLRAQSELYANVSQAYRPVTFADLTPPATTDEVSADLRDARGYVSELGWRGTWKEVVNFDLGAFYLHYARRIGTLARMRDDGSIYQWRGNLGTSAHYGLESYTEVNMLRLLAPKARLGNLNVFASLSWISAHYADFAFTQVQQGSIKTDNLKGKRVEHAPRYVHRLGLTYAWRGFSTTWQLNSVSEVYADAANTQAPSANGQVGLLPAYRVSDWSATWHFKSPYTLRAGINNVGDARYATRRAGGYPGPGLLPGEGRTWYVGLGVKW
ncbi:MAG TPA: TonB-dependent receptor, partial [Saprospiraceae bacterium]|nr:TonB-dependent receptor [Saprospiraceae bacterium]